VGGPAVCLGRLPAPSAHAGGEKGLPLTFELKSIDGQGDLDLFPQYNCNVVPDRERRQQLRLHEAIMKGSQVPVRPSPPKRTAS